MTKNAERSQRALDALLHYKRELLQEGGHIFEEDITDLLTDILHLCEANIYDFDACLRMAKTHHEAEVNYENND